MASRNTHHSRSIAPYLTILLALLLTGCATDLLPSLPTPPAIYLLESSRDNSAKLNPSGPILAVSTVRSAAGFGGADMIYVEQAHRLQAFAHHRWADSPARMLEPLLVGTAENSGLFAGVTGPSSYSRAELRLDTELQRLQQVFSPTGSQVQLALRATLVDMTKGKVLASQMFRVIEPTSEATPYSGVLAANKATDLLLGELQTFLGRALAQPRD